MKKFNIAVVGATGMVGNKFLDILEEKKLPVDNYYLFASKKSAGKKLNLLGKSYKVIELTEENVKALKGKIDIALFSAGGTISKIFAPIFAEIGAIVIDNSSQWRMDKDVPLIVPEVNPEDIKTIKKGIIANPNCSTIQAVLPLKALQDRFGIKRIIYSTYQAVSGAGVQGWKDLEDGQHGESPKKFGYPIYNNVIPQIDVFLENGYTKEEEKMINETRKILHDDSLKITATTVRVPVFNSHSESINVEFKSKKPTVDDIKSALSSYKNIILVDDIKNNKYPMPLHATGSDEVYVGRIRLDDSVESGCNIWCVADNIRKGAAANAIQIAELIINSKK